MFTFQALSALSSILFFLFLLLHIKRLPLKKDQALNRHLWLAMGVFLLFFIIDMTLYMMSESLFAFGETSNLTSLFGLLGFGVSFYAIYRLIFPFIKKGGYRDNSSVGHHLHFQFIMFYIILFIVMITMQSILISVLLYSLF